MRNRSPAIFAYEYLTRVARAFADSGGTDSGGKPPPPAVAVHRHCAPRVVRCNFVTLHKQRIGLKVCAWFWRHTPRKIPELRVGVTFDLNDRQANARDAAAFASRFAPELKSMNAELWLGDSGMDHRHVTPLPVPPAGEDLTELIANAVELAHRYVELLR